jgi:protoporphyrinogen/coproporphyrinogen III oxidase
LGKIAIIGGGISGISAALELLRSQRFQVRLLESSARLGGVLETIQSGGYLIERSADNFSTLIPDAAELSEQYGLTDSLIRPNQRGRQAFVLIDGKIHPIPAGFSLMQPTRIGSILRSGALSWHGKLRLLREFWVPARKISGDESLESFATRRLGREAFEKLVEPIVSGIFTANPATLSMAATMPQFLQMERTAGGLIRGYLAAKKQDAAAAARKASGARYDQFVAPACGMSNWIQGLAAHLPADCVQLETKALELTAAPQADGTVRWLVQCSRQGCEPEVQEFDGIVLATPAAVTADLLKNVSARASQIVSNIPYASSAVVALVLPRTDLATDLDGFGLVVPRREGRPTLAISFTSNKYPGRTPPDQILLRLFLGGALRPDLVDLSDADLFQLAHAELKAILGTGQLHPKWQAVIRWKEAMPQYLVGHQERLQELNRLMEQHSTLQLCGAAYEGVGIPQCVRSGRKAARALLTRIK